MPDRDWSSTVGACAVGLVLGVLAGGLAGLLRAPRGAQERVPERPVAPAQAGRSDVDGPDGR